MSRWYHWALVVVALFVAALIGSLGPIGILIVLPISSAVVIREALKDRHRRYNP